MYVEPNTDIYILDRVPLDPSYEHTLYFENEQAQYDYFSLRASHTLTRQTYQRVNKDVIRVGITADELYTCNYLMFRNTSYGRKWFYAFIQSVEYINDSVSQITFKLDVMQTWYFDYTLEQCFVEREHSATDAIGDNIVPENLELGEDVVANYIYTFDMNDMNVCMLAGELPDNKIQGKTINNVYSALAVYAGVPVTAPSAVTTVINQYVEAGQEDRIVAIYQYPAWLGDASTTEPVVASVNMPRTSTTMDGYIPKNKKLFTYPFCSLLVSNNNGQTATYKFENWGTDSPNATFEIAGVFVPSVGVIAYPTNHRNIEKDYDSGLTLSNFPQCAFTGDTFKSWWAQNKNAVVMSGIASVLGAAVSIGSTIANPALGATSAAAQYGTSVRNKMTAFNTVAGIANTLAKVDDLKNTPPQVHGQTQTDCLNAGIKRMQFTFYCVSIKKEFAEIIDDYFSRFGYACRKNKIPNRSARPEWNYVKTAGCTISGTIPCDDEEAICNIYNNGITFWKHAYNVGNYDLDNSP